MIVGEDNILLIDKPLQWTSFDVVKKVRGRLRIKKVGHAGTLDPLATGLLIICTGKMTKQVAKIQELEKEYEATMVLGATTPSVDLETDIGNKRDFGHLTNDDINSLIPAFSGFIEQVPPAYSAIKIKGQRAYEKARAGKEIKLEPRQVHIKKLEMIKIAIPEVTFRVVCSKGTYIRSLVRGFGEKLEVGAYLSALCRTRIGQYQLEDATKVSDIIPPA